MPVIKVIGWDISISEVITKLFCKNSNLKPVVSEIEPCQQILGFGQLGFGGSAGPAQYLNIALKLS